jgi:pyruvate/2-oxoglutarate/acetoin dehydrogenase E1 component
VACEEVPMPYSKPLEQLVVPDENKIIKAVHQVLGR